MLKREIMTTITDSQVITLGKPPSKWTINCHKGVTITPSTENNTLRLSIANTSGANWHGELIFAPFTVTEGDIYHLSFFARAQNPFTFSVWLGQMESPHSSLVRKENHFGEKTMTPDWQLFTHTWIAIRSEPKARLDFVLGQIDNTVEIKDAVLNKEAV